MVEHVEQQARTLGEGLELVLETDQATGRDRVFQAHAALAVRLHVLQLALAGAQLFHHAALVDFFDVHHQLLDRLHHLAVDFLDDHFRARHGQLVAFATHVLDQHRQVQLATAGDQELVGIFQLFDLQGHVVDLFTVQAVLDLAAGQELATGQVLVAGERRVVDLEGHRDGRLVDGQCRQRFRGVRVAQGVGDGQLRNTGDGDDVTSFGGVLLDALQAQEAQHLRDLAVALLAFAVDHRDLHVLLQGAALDAADADHAHEVVVVQLADAHLEGAFRIDFRLRRVLHDGFVQRST
ncbi:hypothetical protein G6F22_015982 [Rhizopus arrhizus]|nr:hypothetical protein G6F22_015982 [Rhizopus arrhizus]